MPDIAGVAAEAKAGMVDAARAFFAITEAFRHGQASAVAPFEYTALAWGIGLDYLLWTVLPDGFTLIGASIIILAGLYLLRHERVHRQAAVHTSADHP